MIQLAQNQLWKKDDRFFRIVIWERLAIRYKEINPHFPALWSDPMAVSQTSRIKQIPNSGSAFASASETVHNKSGDCTEYAVMLAVTPLTVAASVPAWSSLLTSMGNL
jgi:hypothetical protein